MNDSEVFDYGDLLAFQRVCDASGCERGLLLTPARYCPRCGGTGYLVEWVKVGEHSNARPEQSDGPDHV